MLNTHLTQADVQYLQDKQNQLDKHIINKFDMDYNFWLDDLDINHDIALLIELGEFVNEAHDIWKYWKTKPINRSRLIDEAIDVIHFVFLKQNKILLTTEETHADIQYWCKSVNEFIGEEVKPEHLKLLLQNDYTPIFILANILVILDRYGFTTKDIIDQYNLKNKVNFERQERGY